MKNDEQLATELVVWTNLGSIVTIFVTVFALMTGGLLAVLRCRVITNFVQISLIKIK